MRCQIQPTAFVGPDCDVAEGVKIGAFTCLHGNVGVGLGSMAGEQCIPGAGPLAGENGLAFGAAEKLQAQLQ
jgi:UDP-3-O-[3-hydroxymyristoyl] glucosamine N-acyltransferase